MKTLRLLFVLLLLSFVGGAFAQSAGTGAQSRGLFRDVMSNTTNPSITNGARRGVIYGGDFQMRNKLMNVNLVSFEPPHISAGCGGIDAFMGSFSFISKAQLVAALRSIVSAAIAYAFKLALTSMCPQCEKIMAEMQAKMDSINSGNINSCQIAQSLMNMGGDDSMASNIQQGSHIVGAELGLVDDAEAGQQQGGSSTPDAALKAGDPATAQALQGGNIVWRALVNQDTAVWATNSSNSSLLDPNSLMEDIQSLTGTIIICTSDDTNCGAGAPTGGQVGPKGQLVTHVWQPSMDITDLVEGATQGKSVARLTCVGTDPHGAEGCTNIKRVEDASFIGLKEEIVTVMLGTADGTAAGVLTDPSLGNPNGMINDIAQGNAPTSSELALLQFGGSDIQMAVKLAIRSPVAAENFVMRFADQMAADMAFHIISADLDSGLNAVNQQLKDNIDKTPIRDMIHRSMQRNLELNAKYQRDGSAKNGALEYYKQMSEELTPPFKPQTPAG
jgi:Conjugative relaxosome accessory transposon protein.